MYRVGAAYAVVAWVLLQLVANVAPILDLPPWIARAVLLLLVIGFPVALVFAWVQQLAPDRSVPAPASNVALDWFLACALVVVILLVSYQQFSQANPTPVQEAGVTAARAASATQAGAISVAVLPFSNLSSDPEQEFFSDGMTEEITAALAKISDLRVVARTSAFQFKGENKDLRAVGQALGATHMIEGSVRKSGTRVRITAQLIKTGDGTHIWSENYDRELTDVFAIQEDIATAIAGALRMPLGLAPGERLVASRTIDAEAYQEYLRAKPLVRQRGRGVPQAIKILEPLVANNPNYAPALALLAAAYGLSPNYVRTGSVDDLRRAVDNYLPKAEKTANRAIELDPNLADGYVSLGRVYINRGKYLLAEQAYSKALALDPNNPDALNQYGIVLSNAGRLKDALAVRLKLEALEPFVTQFNGETAELQWLLGQNDAAISTLKDFPAGDGNRGSDLARVYASLGRFNDAADAMQKGSSLPPFPVAVSLLRAAPTETASPQDLPRFGRNWFVYLYAGAQGRALEYYEDMVKAGFFAPGGADNALLWHPSYSALRKTDRFKAFVRNDGLVDYWRAKGWPEFCRPTTGDDFVCD